MEHFYIITNELKDQDNKTTMELKDLLETKGKSCVLCKKDEHGNIVKELIPKETQCVLVLGGDGTLIRAARELKGLGIPLLGVNLGTLGYLTEVEVSHMGEAVDQLCQQTPVIEERMMLRGKVSGHDEDFALNDVVVTRQGSLRIICFSIYVNGALLNSYQADGIIVSTPTGSTGYNLSAGGPIVEPEASMIVITPICPHVLNTRSIVLSAEDEIVIELDEGKDGYVERAAVTFDGSDFIEVHTGDQIQICMAKDKTKFLKLSNVSFLETLRRKMKGN